MCKLTGNICQSETSPLIGWSEVCLPIDLPCFQLTLYTSNFFSESENYYPISRTPILGCLLLCIQPISSIRWERRKSLACFLSTFPYHLRCGKSKDGRRGGGANWMGGEDLKFLVIVCMDEQLLLSSSYKLTKVASKSTTHNIFMCRQRRKCFIKLGWAIIKLLG